MATLAIRDIDFKKHKNTKSVHRIRVSEHHDQIFALVHLLSSVRSLLILQNFTLFVCFLLDHDPSECNFQKEHFRSESNEQIFTLILHCPESELRCCTYHSVCMCRVLLVIHSELRCCYPFSALYCYVQSFVVVPYCFTLLSLFVDVQLYVFLLMYFFIQLYSSRVTFHHMITLNKNIENN